MFFGLLGGGGGSKEFNNISDDIDLLENTREDHKTVNPKLCSSLSSIFNITICKTKAENIVAYSS